jgi:hypothetical protein
MASLTITAEDAPPVSAKEFAAQQTRRRHSSGGSTKANVGRIVDSSSQGESKPLVAEPHLVGNFSGCGGAVGVSIRVELVFVPNEKILNVWVWSSATESFDIQAVGYTLNEDNTFTFGPELMKAMEGRVVKGMKATWNPDKDNIFLRITIKVGRWVPSFDITTTCVGVETIVGAVKAVEGKGVVRKRPY